PDELIERVYEQPNYEYYILLASADSDDQHYLMASWEIARHYPLYVARFSIRNFARILFDPGYAHTRRNAVGFHRVGLDFPPTTATVVGADTIEPRALREVNYNPLAEQPISVQLTMHHLKLFWDSHFGDVVFATSVLMLIAWAGVLLRLICVLIP